MFKKAVFAAAPLAVLGGFAVAGTAHAATITYSDTSVSVAGSPVVDAITGITATFGTPAASLVGSAAVQVPAGDKVQFGSSDASAKWSIVPTTSGATITAAGLLSLPTVPVTAPVPLTVEATDGTAVAVATVNVGVGGSALDDSVSVTSDTVTLPVAATDNTTGTVNFGTVPAGVTETLGNAPAGVALSNGVLSATNAVPGDYKGVTVTAKDSGGATAVETLAIDVKGTKVEPTPPPAPTPRPHLYNGHVITVNNNDAEIGWNFGPGVTCALTRTFGYGFTVYGSPHQGFTCYNPAENAPGTDVGYWGGLAAGHGYDIQLIPANPTTRQPLPNAQTGWIYIHTTS